MSRGTRIAAYIALSLGTGICTEATVEGCDEAAQLALRCLAFGGSALR